MGYLSVPYDLIYEARSFRSGLEDVVAMVTTPHREVLGPFHMAELSAPFTGVYVTTFISLVDDPPGTYTVMIFSPTEGIKYTDRMELYVPPSGSVQPTQGAGGGQLIEGVVERPTVLARLTPDVGVKGIVLPDEVKEAELESLELEAIVGRASVTGLVDQTSIEGDYELP